MMLTIEIVQGCKRVLQQILWEYNKRGEIIPVRKGQREVENVSKEK